MNNFKCPECNDTGEVCIVNTFKVPCKRCPQPKAKTRVPGELTEKIFQQLYKSPEGLRTLSVSAKRPMLLRHHYSSVARKVWGRFDETTATRGYAPFADTVCNVDLVSHSGKNLEGESLLPKYERLSDSYERAMDQVVRTVGGLEVDLFTQLLRTTPGIQTVEAFSIGAGLDKILESEKLLAIVLDAKQLASLVKAKQAKSPWPKNVLGHGRPFLYGEQRDVHLLVCREAAGEVWAFVEGSGVADMDVDLEVSRDSVKWKANLKLAVVDSSKIFRVCSKETQ